MMEDAQNLIWHPCKLDYEVDLHLQHDGTWQHGKWYYWKDIHGKVEKARMKDDAVDHFWPPVDYLDEENIVAFAEIPSYALLGHYDKKEAK